MACATFLVSICSCTSAFACAYDHPHSHVVFLLLLIDSFHVGEKLWLFALLVHFEDHIFHNYWCMDFNEAFVCQLSFSQAKSEMC